MEVLERMFTYTTNKYPGKMRQLIMEPKIIVDQKLLAEQEEWAFLDRDDE